MRDEASVAAKWWADCLRTGNLGSNKSGHEPINRDSVLQDAFFQVMRKELQDKERNSLSASQVDQFEQNLAEIVRKTMMETEGWEKAKQNNNWGRACRVLEVDYAPCDELRAAYQSVGGDIRHTDQFPIKTMMWIGPGSVRVSCGYGAKDIELWKEGGA